jgi:hypothetical protein
MQTQNPTLLGGNRCDPLVGLLYMLVFLRHHF